MPSGPAQKASDGGLCPTAGARISVLIPCHNEEKSITACVESCLRQTRPPDEIVVVDDGSTDDTPRLLAEFGDSIKVVRIPQKTGAKSRAQEIGLRHVTGDLLVTTDADTVLHERFIERAALHFADSRVTAAAGYVRSLPYNWLTACRAIDYFIGQNIHKLAQACVNAVHIIPGCAAVFRTEIFQRYVTFDHDTLTEDLDFTYKLHRNSGGIIFDRKMIVYTQDPGDLSSYIIQMRRWYAGSWQNLVKHLAKIMPRPACVFEIALLYGEAIIFPLVLVIMLLINIDFLFAAIIFYFSILLSCAALGAVVEKRVDMLIYAPLHIGITAMNAWLFIEQFIRVVLLRRRTFVWSKPARREFG